MDIREIESEVKSLAHRFRERLSSEKIDEICQFTESGEPGVAFEYLCEELHECHVALSSSEIEKCQLIGTAMGIDPSYWMILYGTH